MTDRAPFEPLGEQARWRTVYELLTATPMNGVITYKELGDALVLDPDSDRKSIQDAMRRAAKQHEVTDKRAAEVVPDIGYRVIEPREHIDVARRFQRKSGRALVRGHSQAVNVDLNGVEPEVRNALELLGHAFTLQMDFNRRFEGKQARLERTIREIADSQAEDRKRTAEEVAELRARLARLEGEDPAGPEGDGQ
jgi:hypothetical protein